MSNVAEFTIVRLQKFWIIRLDGMHVGGFASQEVAEGLVLHLVEERCKEGKASRVTIEDGDERQVAHCRCFADPPPGTPRH